MADLISRNRTLFAKLETTHGTANAPAAGDAILATGIEVKLPVTMNAREYQGAPGERASVPGGHEGTGLSFQTELKGNGTTTLPEVDELLTACFGSVAASNLDSTISGTAGSATVLDVTDAANASVGSLAMVECATADTYEVVGIITTVDTGATPDDVTVSPGASSGTTPAAYATNAKKVKELRTWQVLVPPGAVNSLTMDVYHNADSGASQRDRIVGALGTFKWDSPRAGQIPMLSWDFMGHSWSQVTNGTRPTPTYDTTTPKPAQAAKFRVDNTLTDAFDISFDLGAEVVQKLSQNATKAVYGTVTTNIKPRGSFKIHPASSSIAEFTALEAGTLRSLLFQVGNTLYGTIAWYVPKAQVVSVSRVDDNGVGALQIDWIATTQDDALATACDASFYLGVG